MYIKTGVRKCVFERLEVSVDAYVWSYTFAVETLKKQLNIGVFKDTFQMEFIRHIIYGKIYIFVCLIPRTKPFAVWSSIVRGCARASLRENNVIPNRSDSSFLFSFFLQSSERRKTESSPVPGNRTPPD